MYVLIWWKNQIHPFTPFKLRDKPHSKYKKTKSHKKMVVNLQPQCDFCKNQLHHNEKRGLPRRFTIYFDSFCPNPKYDTGLPPIYIVNADCTWFWWRKLVVLLPLKLIFVVNILHNWNNRSAQRIRCAERLFQLCKILTTKISFKGNKTTSLRHQNQVQSAFTMYIGGKPVSYLGFGQNESK